MAIEYKNISFKEYYDLSVEERKIKPYCIEFSDGAKHWKVNRKLHHEDAPAVIWDDGSIVWCLNDIEYSFERWCKILNKTDEEKIFLKLKYFFY